MPASLQKLVRLENAAGIAAQKRLLVQTPTRETLLVALLAERTELRRLEHRADSLLLALGVAALPPVASTDTTRPQRATPIHRWSLLLSATPEQSYLGLKMPASDTLNSARRNETGRLGFSATLLGEYRLTNRLSLGAGLGYLRSGTELRLSERRTDVSVRFDTTTTTSARVFSSTQTSFTIHLRRVTQFTPRLNGSGQVIGYDTVYVSRPDTTFTTTVRQDTVRTTNRTINPRLTKKEVVNTKNLRPDYHFFTLPLVARYRLLPQQGRWWADVTVGVQLQFFLGGTQIVTDDGRTFYTEKVGPRGGPFRPLNIGLSGSMALNYALTPRLSLSLAPGLRWQVLSVYKPETGLRQNPVVTGVQLGVRWQL